MNVVIYARYSSDKQREESIEGQLKACYDYAKREGHTVISEYIDRALSAKTDKRPDFLRMIEDSKKGNFGGIVVYQLDRFARNRYDSARYKAILKKNGVKVLSANETIAEDASGILLESLLEGYAEYYVAELSEKVERGMKLNAQKGMFNGGAVPLGYKIENQKYVIDTKKAQIVKEIFQKYADGMNIAEICNDLNRRGEKSSTGKPFKNNSFHAMLKNRRYLGIYIYKDIEIQGGIPQIIDEELFNKVAERMRLNKKLPARKRAKAEYLLTTKLFCGYCKEMMVGHSSNKTNKNGIIYNYYKCKNSGSGKSCKKKMVMKNYIEDVVINECRKILTEKNIHRIAVEVVKISKKYDEDNELRRLEKQLQKTQEEKDNIMSALRSCTENLAREMIFEELHKIAEEISAINEQLAIERARHHIVTLEQVEEFLTRLSKGDIENIAHKRTLIKVLVNKIYLYDDKFTITFNSGDEEVTITDKMLSEIETGLNEKVCLLNASVHQNRQVSIETCQF